jgi:hypothetical protein
MTLEEGNDITFKFISTIKKHYEKYDFVFCSCLFCIEFLR